MRDVIQKRLNDSEKFKTIRLSFFFSVDNLKMKMTAGHDIV